MDLIDKYNKKNNDTKYIDLCNKMDNLQNSLIKIQNLNINKQFDFINEAFDKINNRIQSLEKNVDHLKMYINNLDKGDTNLSIEYICEDNTHDIVASLTKDKYIELIMNELLDI